MPYVCSSYDKIQFLAAFVTRMVITPLIMINMQTYMPVYTKLKCLKYSLHIGVYYTQLYRSLNLCPLCSSTAIKNNLELAA